MQLAGHLQGRASQEWKLLLLENRSLYQVSLRALRERLDPGNQTWRLWISVILHNSQVNQYQTLSSG